MAHTNSATTRFTIQRHTIYRNKNEYKRTHIHKVEIKNYERNIYILFACQISKPGRGGKKGKRGVDSIKSVTRFDKMYGLQKYIFVVFVG